MGKMKDVYIATANAAKDKRAALSRLRMMHRQGLITTREFDAERKLINDAAEAEAYAIAKRYMALDN
jgi:hypothetical protein